MFLTEPQPTPYDLHFHIFGTAVRVSPYFWLANALLGWELAQALDGIGREASPGPGMLLLLWIAGVFVSILVHELGHVWAMRYYGIRASIVLYHFGGLAVPESTMSYLSFSRGTRRENQMVISAAGPGAEFALAIVLLLLIRLAGYHLRFPIPYLDRVLPLADGGTPISSFPLEAFLFFVILPSVYWALMNLLPVYPLDGGHIARDICLRISPQDGVRTSLILSVITGAAVAAYAVTKNDFFLAIMFGMLAVSSFQVLQAYSGRGGGYGPW